MIKIVYVDDLIDKYISKYLLDKFSNEYCEISFDTEQSYEYLLNEIIKCSPCVILIDSNLFENRNVVHKFTGEELMVILKSKYPFCEVCIITQNSDTSEKFDGILKYRQGDTIKYDEYYDEKLMPYINHAKENIQRNTDIISSISNNETFDKVISENLDNLLNGEDEYNFLTKTDIDNLVKAFKDLKKVMSHE